MLVRTKTHSTSAAIDRDPLVPVHAFDNNSTAASTVVLGAAIPEALHRLPSFRITTLVNFNVPLSFCTLVRQMISFLVVFSEDVFHVTVDLRDRKCDLFFPPRV